MTLSIHDDLRTDWHHDDRQSPVSFTSSAVTTLNMFKPFWQAPAALTENVLFYSLKEMKVFLAEWCSTDLTTQS